MLASLVNAFSPMTSPFVATFVAACNELKKTLQEMHELQKVNQKFFEILNRSEEESVYLISIAQKNLTTYYIRYIWQWSKTYSIPLSTLTEDRIHLILDKSGIYDACALVFKEVITCEGGMVLAEISSLNLSLIMPKSVELDIKSKLSPAVFVQRPALSNNIKEYTKELYKVLLNRDKKNPLYALEYVLCKSDIEIEEKTIHMFICADIPESVSEIICKKIDRILDVFLDCRIEKNSIKKMNEGNRVLEWSGKGKELS